MSQSHVTSKKGGGINFEMQRHYNQYISINNDLKDFQK